MAEIDVTVELRVIRLETVKGSPGLTEVTLGDGDEGPWLNLMTFRLNSENAPKLGEFVDVRVGNQR